MLLNLLTNQLPEGGRMVEIPEALLYALIGFLVVFAGIAFLIAVVWAVGKVLDMKKGKVQVKPQPVTPPQPKTTAPAVEEDAVDDETVAVIMAALMAFYQTNNTKCEFIVKRIKRI